MHVSNSTGEKLKVNFLCPKVMNWSRRPHSLATQIEGSLPFLTFSCGVYRKGKHYECPIGTDMDLVEVYRPMDLVEVSRKCIYHSKCPTYSILFQSIAQQLSFEELFFFLLIKFSSQPSYMTGYLLFKFIISNALYSKFVSFNYMGNLLKIFFISLVSNFHFTPHT